MLTRKLFAIRGKKSLTEEWKLVLVEFNKKLIIFCKYDDCEYVLKKQWDLVNHLRNALIRFGQNRLVNCFDSISVE